MADDRKTKPPISEIEFLALIVNVIVASVAFFMILIGKGSDTWWTTFSRLGLSTFGFIILMLQIFYNLESIQMVKLDQKAILLLFGSYMYDVNPGLVYVPWGICSLIVASTRIIEKDIPDDPKFIWHGDADTVPLGFSPPVRVTFAPNPTEEVKFKTFDGHERTIPKDDAYHQRNTAEVEASYGWQIDDLYELVVRLGSKNTLAKAQSQMDDTAVRTFNSIFSKITAAEAQTKLKEVEAEVIRELEETTNDWGITVKFFGIKPFNYSHDLNTAVREASSSLPRQQAVMRAAEGERVRLEKVGLGNAAALAAKLKAQAEGEEARAKVAATSGGQYALAIEAIQSGLETANTIIVPQDNMFGAVAGIAELIKRIPQTPPSQDNPPTPTQGQGGQRPPQQQDGGRK